MSLGNEFSDESYRVDTNTTLSKIFNHNKNIDLV